MPPTFARVRPMSTAYFRANGRGECRQLGLEYVEHRFSKTSIQRAAHSSAEYSTSRQRAFYVEHMFS
ncbi:hypothetical protein BN2476_300062 [Paraburkholderia piptadeniae]|uniref:Uncharacterized protein n=1 Tax=Paraburkholderia piptadeniae TaxID=1701573 RepID=A0A1N7S2E5_9BURK|nr:hypothetical protein BN2476_300062 [Paraburkholderia piptadeniae]